MAKLVKSETGYFYWCPACEETHHVRITAPSGNWTFDGNMEAPTFTPSVRVTGKQGINKEGRWTGEYKCGPDGKALDLNCHCFITAGNIIFLPDSTHELKGKTVPLPDVPTFATE